MADSALKLESKHYDWISSFLNIDLRGQEASGGDERDDSMAVPVASPGGPPRSPKAKAGGPSLSAAKLSTLAKNPAEAHQAWKTLSSDDKSAVVAEMTKHYGSKFSDEFKKIADSGKADPTVIYWQPGVGPTPEQLKAGGWHFNGMEVTGNAAFEVQVWVHPTGKIGRRDVSTYQSPRQPEEVPPEDPCAEIKTKLKALTDRLDKAMTDLDATVAKLESLPPGSDRTQLDKDYHDGWNKVRGILDELSKLEEDAKDVDDECANPVSDDWMDGMEALTTLVQRFNSVK
jgi:hypothetical protein